MGSILQDRIAAQEVLIPRCAPYSASTQKLAAYLPSGRVIESSSRRPTGELGTRMPSSATAYQWNQLYPIQ